MATNDDRTVPYVPAVVLHPDDCCGGRVIGPLPANGYIDCGFTSCEGGAPGPAGCQPGPGPYVRQVTISWRAGTNFVSLSGGDWSLADILGGVPPGSGWNAAEVIGQIAPSAPEAAWMDFSDGTVKAPPTGYSEVSVRLVNDLYWGPDPGVLLSGFVGERNAVDTMCGTFTSDGPTDYYSRDSSEGIPVIADMVLGLAMPPIISENRNDGQLIFIITQKWWPCGDGQAVAPPPPAWTMSYTTEAFLPS